MNVLLILHSLIRWAIVIVTVIALVRFAWAWLRRSPMNRSDSLLMTIFVRLLEVQMLVGLILLLWIGFAGAGFPSYRLAHAGTMIVAVIVGHLPRRWQNADASIRARNNVIAILGVLVLVFIGVSLLPGGWTR
jgi:hypothetical protein